MNFGKIFQDVVTENSFFGLCEEDNCTYTEMKERLKEIDENKDDIDGVNHYIITRIQIKLYNLESCPRCNGDFFHDDENDEKYCPRCYRG